MPWSIQDMRNYLLLNPLTTMSDQDRTSPHGINNYYTKWTLDGHEEKYK